LYTLQESYIRDAIGSQLLSISLMPAHAVSRLILTLLGLDDLFFNNMYEVTVRTSAYSHFVVS